MLISGRNWSDQIAEKYTKAAFLKKFKRFAKKGVNLENVYDSLDKAKKAKSKKEAPKAENA